MKIFIDAISKLGQFTKDDLTTITQIATPKSVAPGDHLLEAGEVSSTLFFLQSGALLRSGRNEEGEFVVRDLFVGGDWVIDHKSFTGRSPAVHSIKAHAASQLLALEIEGLHELIAASPVFFQLGSILKMATARQEFFDQYESPEDRYRHILAHRAELVQQFPLKFIASYLRMTPETLSRVRKRISSK
ncbi:MAG: CRP-like cAMP-binding protein [Neolewinella sp.]|jgi:CRP-like cAMP-binding protein